MLAIDIKLDFSYVLPVASYFFSTLSVLKDILPKSEYVNEIRLLWEKQKRLEKQFEDEKESHRCAQAGQQDRVEQIKAEPSQKKVKVEAAIPLPKRNLFYGTPLASSSGSSSSRSSTDNESSFT